MKIGCIGRILPPLGLFPRKQLASGGMYTFQAGVRSIIINNPKVLLRKVMSQAKEEAENGLEWLVLPSAVSTHGQLSLSQREPFRNQYFQEILREYLRLFYKSSFEVKRERNHNTRAKTFC